MDNIPLIDLQLDVQEGRGDSTNKDLASVDILIPRSNFQDAYDCHQALHIRGYNPLKSANNNCADCFHADDVWKLFNSLGEKDKLTWCIENKANHTSNDDNDAEGKPYDFLHNNKKGRGYCSFLVQHTEEVLVELLTRRLPLVDLPVMETSNSNSNAVMKVEYGPCLWLFFGKNYNSDESLRGRPEHTDSVTYDGTFHYQLSGTKTWHLRPTTELMYAMREHKKQSQCSLANKKRKVEEDSSKEEPINHIEVECKEGDILLLNTRLWWHSTTIPCQDVPSISYARDIFFTEKNDDCAIEHQPERETSMTNVDGTYAADDIEADTILFTEHNMPDIELPRSKDPNCQVVELENDDGETYAAVVSLRDIKSGEFFTLLDSDEDDSDGDYDEEGWEEEEEEKED